MRCIKLWGRTDKEKVEYLEKPRREFLAEYVPAVVLVMAMNNFKISNRVMTN